MRQFSRLLKNWHKQLAAQELMETVEDRVALLEDDLSDLASLVETWNELPAILRAGILAMVRSSV